MNDLLDRFFRYLESLFEKSDITVTQPLENAAATALISCIVSLFLAALTAYFGYSAYRKQRNVSSRQILGRMIFEVSDTIRHILSGLKILEKADRHRMLAAMHFKKMKVSKQSLFFDAEIIHYYPARYDRIFRKCSLLLRNYNIELDAIISYIDFVSEGHDFDADYYQRLLDYYVEKSQMLVTCLRHELCVLVNCNCRKCPLHLSFSDYRPEDEDGKNVYTSESFNDEHGLCQMLPKADREKILRYRRIPFVAGFVRRRLIKRYISAWRSPDSINSVVYKL